MEWGGCGGVVAEGTEGEPKGEQVGKVGFREGADLLPQGLSAEELEGGDGVWHEQIGGLSGAWQGEKERAGGGYSVLTNSFIMSKNHKWCPPYLPITCILRLFQPLSVLLVVLAFFPAHPPPFFRDGLGAGEGRNLLIEITGHGRVYCAGGAFFFVSEAFFCAQGGSELAGAARGGG